MIGKEGDLSIYIKFSTIDKLKKFENESNQFIEDLKKTFVFKENQYAGVFVYNYESEATSAQIKMSEPVKKIITTCDNKCDKIPINFINL